ncbi:Anaphase-promoting complex subunit 1 [Coniosporium tulheliwenetii]|uniref:Anaphase-promoting complex subunit 1 n=1 Tax=Coniosporium tulheliwenetii TaxID=3383036 RepID=A0ACC2ZHI4_9PEZI|nr:Anaphase-promoting complex subunit 1 [Cladosporium sp. JES 115]
MASLRSLGLHTPTGLQYLIAEHILPEEPSEEQYHWETYNDHEAGDEEVLVTDYCVVYSRGGFVQKVFRFEIEQQKVVQAILTWFPADDIPPFVRSHDQEFRQNTRGGITPDFSGDATAQSKNVAEASSAAGSAQEHRPSQQSRNDFRTRRSRALVVFLKLQAHVFFLAGSTHVVNLPFEVERAFAAPRGLILQRKLPVSENVAPTPVLPQVPQNSFFSQSQSQSQFRTRLSASFVGASQRLSSSFNVSRGSKGPRAASKNTQFFADLLRDSKITTTDELPRLFSFTDPLSEMGLVVTTPLRPTSSLTGNGASTGDFVSLEKAEEVLFVSKGSEVPGNSEVTDSPLIVVVTVNYDTAMYSVWYASYVEPRRVSSIRKRQPKPAGNKMRRRSSYVPGTGTTTPGLRTRDGLRESMGGAAVRSKTVPTYAGISKVKPSSGSQSVEEALASQLDPDYDLPGQPAKESRRVSSLLSRADLSTSFDKTAFQDLATQRANLGTSFGAHGRRGHSYGGYNDRRSLDAYPVAKFRASTSGSMLRLSFGEASIDETSETHDMDGDTELFDIDDTLEDSFLDDLDSFALYEPIDGLKKEFVMLKFAEIPIGAQVSALRFGSQQERHPFQVLH